MSDTRASFTSADAVPVKLLQDVSVIRSILSKGSIPPVHVQILPTNRCNLKCSFCSCAEEDKTLEMDLNDVWEIFRVLPKLGTKAITITGGGEPTMFQHLSSLIFEAHRRNIKVGLVTNGLLIDAISPETLKKLTWCRISAADERKLTMFNTKQIISAVKSAPTVDWAFSYVVSDEPDASNIIKYLSLAEELRFTHVRLVADLLKTQEVNMDELKEVLTTVVNGMTTPAVFQARSNPEQGKDCRICYLRPVIGPDMNVYACCGVQYALPTPSKKLPEELCLGRFQDFENIIKNQHLAAFANGNLCAVCYYGEYNRLLSAMTTRVKHEEFV